MKMWMLAIATLSIAACTAHARSPEPVPVDRVDCAHCRMLISTENGAGEIVSPRDDTRFYDDVACLAAAYRPGDVAFVRVGGGWSDTTSAWFAQPLNAHTAMASGYVAFTTEADARAADRDGRALVWDDVVKATGERR